MYRYTQYRTVLPLHDEVADCRVEGTERVIEQADVCVNVERTRKTHARFLSARQHHTFLAHHGQVAVRQVQNVLHENSLNEYCFNEKCITDREWSRSNLVQSSCFQHSRVSDRVKLFAEDDILSERARKHPRRLRHVSN